MKLANNAKLKEYFSSRNLDSLFNQIDNVKLIIILTYADEPFTTELFEEVFSTLDIQNVFSANLLKNRSIFSKTASGEYKISKSIENVILELQDLETVEECGAFWGNFMIQKAQETDDHNAKSEFITRAIKIYQRARLYKDSCQTLLKNSQLIKLTGHYCKFIELATVEINSNPWRNRWVDWNYAYCNFVIGDFQLAYKTITSLIKQSLTNPFDISKKQNISLLAKSFQLYSEILSQVGHEHDALDIMTRSCRLLNLSNSEGQTRIQFYSTISWLYIKTKDNYLCIGLNERLLRDIDISQIGEAACMTRIGIAYQNLSDYQKALKYLERGSILFIKRGVEDKRGTAWCYLHLAICYHELNNEHLLTYYIKECIEISKSINIASYDYINNLLILKKNIKNDSLKMLLIEEVNRIENTLKQYNFTLSHEYIVKDFMKIYAETSNFMQKHGILSETNILIFQPVDETQIKIGSNIIRTLVNRAKSNIGLYLTRIFDKEKNKHRLFGNLIYTKILTECLKNDEEQYVYKKFIKPNISIIKDRGDKSILHFARALEYSNNTFSALDLLKYVNHENFDYFNIMGNCYRKKDFETSLSYYNSALQLTRNKHEKAIVYNNIARLIYLSSKKSMYNEAKEYCMYSYELNFHNKKFPFPIHFLILIEIEESTLENIVNIVNKRMREFNLNETQKPEIFRQVKSRLKRNALFSSLNILNEEVYLEAPSLENDGNNALEIHSSQLINSFNKVLPGAENAQNYHKLCISALDFIFNTEIASPTKEQVIGEGIGRIDILYLNISKDGFFFNLQEMHNFKCPYIPIECKNINKDPASDEFAQLYSRLGDNIGKVGILLCRNIKDKQNVLKRSKHFYDKKRSCIIVLEDADLKNLIEHKKLGKEIEIRNYMENILKTIIL